MIAFNLDALSLNELRRLQKDLARAIVTYEDQQRAKARAKVEAAAREMGYSLVDLVRVEKKVSRSVVSLRYRHPVKENITWSGRGRKPHWFTDHINAGKDPGELAI